MRWNCRRGIEEKERKREVPVSGSAIIKGGERRRRRIRSGQQQKTQQRWAQYHHVAGEAGLVIVGLNDAGRQEEEQYRVGFTSALEGLQAAMLSTLAVLLRLNLAASMFIWERSEMKRSEPFCASIACRRGNQNSKRQQHG